MTDMSQTPPVPVPVPVGQSFSMNSSASAASILSSVVPETSALPPPPSLPISPDILTSATVPVIPETIHEENIATIAVPEVHEIPSIPSDM